ncbi:hypothetical protein [Streptomyces sp. SPB162]|nr:hypothetical protein [Streptomyces sp. SPB162]MDF9810937.1 hypothetical protein [Streptomyces sp. SPB162]
MSSTSGKVISSACCSPSALSLLISPQNVPALTIETRRPWGA